MIVQYRPPLSRILRQIGKPLAVLLVWSSGIAVLHHYIQPFRIFALPDMAVSIFGAALGIFLGFRTNSAYARWWEARTLWGGLINQSRSWARQVLAFVPDPVAARELVIAQIGYAYALRGELQGDFSWTEVEPFWPEELRATLRGHQNKSAGLLAEQGRRITAFADECRMSEQRLQRLDATLSELTNVQGGCERIRNTPLPRQYDYYPELFIYVYCALLPIAVADELGALIPGVTVLVATVFLILNRIGKNLEDPFERSIYALPMQAMCRTIEINLRQAVGDSDVPSPVREVRGVLA